MIPSGSRSARSNVVNHFRHSNRMFFCIKVFVCRNTTFGPAFDLGALGGEDHDRRDFRGGGEDDIERCDGGLGDDETERSGVMRGIRPASSSVFVNLGSIV